MPRPERRPRPGAAQRRPRRSWRDELRAVVTTAAELEQHLELCAEERAGIAWATANGFGLRLTPTMLARCDPHDPGCPVRRQLVPRIEESRPSPGDELDPLDEAAHELAPSLVRRYRDRALLLVTDQCASHCRFCTRRRTVGRGRGPVALARLRPALEAIAARPEIRDVIVSGGDPLTMTTPRLSALLAALRAIEHVEVIRLATRAPASLPSRIDAELTAALRRFRPLWVVTHFNHARELGPAALRACGRLVDAGLPMVNQTVLLRGVNDSVAALSELCRALVRARVKPYYLMQMDPASGTGHLRTPLGRGIELMAELQRELSGLALPKLVVDTPGGRGKVPLGPRYVLETSGGRAVLQTPAGEDVTYLDPDS